MTETSATSALVLLCLLVGMISCADVGAETGEASSRGETLASGRICEPRSTSSAGARLAELEEQDGATSIVDRPRVQECVERRLDELGDDIDRYCAGLRRLVPNDPLAEHREADLRHTLVLAYRDLAWKCRSANPDESLLEEEVSASENEELLYGMSREWCTNPDRLFARFGRIAVANGIPREQSDCLARSRSPFLAEMDRLCKAGWKDFGDGPAVIYGWYASCGVKPGEHERAIGELLDP